MPANRLPFAAFLGRCVLSVALPIGEALGAPHGAQFDYFRGSLAEGTITGNCTSHAVIFHKGPGSVQLDGRAGTLEAYTTELNLSAIEPRKENPTWTTLNIRQWHDDQVVHPGAGRLSWNESSSIRIFGEGWPSESPESPVVPFQAAYHSESLRSEPPSSHVKAGVFFAKRDGVVYENQYPVFGTNQILHLKNGAVVATGNVTVLFTSAHWEGPNGQDYQAPRYRENVSSTETDVVGVYQVRLHHTLLRLQNARMEFDADKASLACQQTRGHIEGTFVAYGAGGRVAADNRSVGFSRQELALQGVVDFAESVQQSKDGEQTGVSFAGQGQFTAVGIDFVDAGIVAADVVNWARVSLWAAIVAAGATGLAWVIKSVWPLYSRLEKPALLDQTTRLHVVDALRTQPWMNVAELQRTTGLGRSTVRYQLSVLTRNGVIAAKSTTWGSRFAVRTASVPQLPPNPVAELIRQEVARAPVRLSTLMRLIQASQSLSRTSAWESIQRSARQGLVTIARQEGGVWVRRV